MSDRWTDGSEQVRRRNHVTPERGEHRCELCRGSGEVPGMVKVTGKGSGMGSRYGLCPDCDGTGVVRADDEEDEEDTG